LTPQETISGSPASAAQNYQQQLPTTPITTNIGSGLQQQRQRLRQCRPQRRSQPLIASPRRVTAFNNPQRRSHRSSLSPVPALLTISTSREPSNSTSRNPPSTSPSPSAAAPRPAATPAQQPRPAATPDATTSSPRADGLKQEHGVSHRRQRRQQVTETREARKKGREATAENIINLDMSSPRQHPCHLTHQQIVPRR